YTRTITTAVMCGIDTDCNAGTAGSIVGAAIGIGGIDARWTEPLHDTIHSAVAAFGTCSISEIEARICALGEARAARENQLIHPRKV
ncbi:MAG: ADP-ribosylglycohydrolase family protein, partial [Clostridiales bacterium]|nr:ADP-ribosylglycohydrolase family protein [Clostridiales bacterium]